MKKRPNKSLGAIKLTSLPDGSRILRPLLCLLTAILAWMIVPIHMALSEQISQKASDRVTIQGVVRSPDGKPVSDAVVRLEKKGNFDAVETKTTASGDFAFLNLLSGTYVLTAEKAGLRSLTTTINALSPGDPVKVNLVLDDTKAAPSASSIQAMTFADQPNFTVAGVTDWTAVGGHGSDSSLRTSEALASETSTLKSGDPEHNATNVTSNLREANSHRLAGDLDEKSGDALAAVHEYEQAVRLDPSEQNYFSWGSELLLHRAVLQAQEVFSKGAELYPKSARMLTALGAALFAGARYEEAALRLCNASDLNPANPEPYIFMGKIQMAAPNNLACVEQKLSRFAQEQPGNALANYFYAMAMLKRQQQAADEETIRQAEQLLTKAVMIDAKCGDAYLQLGILAASEHKLEKAIDFYAKAISANPQLGEAHYRLAMAYDRIGEPAKAKQELQLYAEIKKQQADAIEQQRREIKQFLVVLPEPSTHPPVK